jgi:hypothetical protein
MGDLSSSLALVARQHVRWSNNVAQILRLLRRNRPKLKGQLRLPEFGP